MPYTNIERSIIKPHDRYNLEPDYPRSVILCHHHSYLDLVKRLSSDTPSKTRVSPWNNKDHIQLVEHNGVPILLDDAKDNAEESVTHLIKHIMHGAINIINIGSAGAINQEIGIGDFVVGDRAIRDNQSTWNFATPDVEAKSDPLLTSRIKTNTPESLSQRARTGDVWTTGNMYYTWDRLAELQRQNRNLECVETEMEALCVTTGWLTANYFDKRQHLPTAPAIANLFYISDKLPKGGEKWIDTMNGGNLLIPFKTQALLWALDTLSMQT